MMDTEQLYFSKRIGRARVVLSLCVCAFLTMHANASEHEAHHELSQSRPVLATKASASSQNPFEPTVTREESKLLEQALNLSSDDLPAAIALLSEKTHPQSSPALDFALGNFHYLNGDLSAAEQAYVKATRKLPSFRAARNNLARIYLTRDKPQRAMSVFQTLVRDGQGDGATYRVLGHCFDQLSQPISAESAYRHALLLEPGHAESMRGLARSLIQQERYTEVLALTRELQSQDPYNEELWSLRANAHLFLNQYDSAINAIETAQLLGAASTNLYATLGDLYLNRGQAQDAVAAYTQAFAGTSADAHHLLRAVQGLLSYASIDEAEQLLQHVDKLARDSGLSPAQAHHANRLRADLARLQGKSEDAAQIYSQLLRNDPLDADVMLALAELHRDAQRREEARALLEQASRVDGFEADALAQLARLSVEEGRFSDAVILLERAQAFAPKDHIAHYLEQVRRLAPP